MNNVLKKLKEYKVEDEEERFKIDLLIRKIKRTKDSLYKCVKQASYEYALITCDSTCSTEKRFSEANKTRWFYNGILDKGESND